MVIRNLASPTFDFDISVTPKDQNGGPVLIWFNIVKFAYTIEDAKRVNKEIAAAIELAEKVEKGFSYESKPLAETKS